MDIQRALVRAFFASNKIPNTISNLPKPDQTNTIKVDTFPPYSFGYLRGHFVLSTLVSNTKLVMYIYTLKQKSNSVGGRNRTQELEPVKAHPYQLACTSCWNWSSCLDLGMGSLIVSCNNNTIVRAGAAPFVLANPNN